MDQGHTFSSCWWQRCCHYSLGRRAVSSSSGPGAKNRRGSRWWKTCRRFVVFALHLSSNMSYLIKFLLNIFLRDSETKWLRVTTIFVAWENIRVCLVHSIAASPCMYLERYNNGCFSSCMLNCNFLKPLPRRRESENSLAAVDCNSYWSAAVSSEIRRDHDQKRIHVLHFLSFRWQTVRRCLLFIKFWRYFK